jgi:hypothetical protein
MSLVSGTQKGNKQTHVEKTWKALLIIIMIIIINRFVFLLATIGIKKEN